WNLDAIPGERYGTANTRPSIQTGASTAGMDRSSKVQFDKRWTTGNMDLVRSNAESLVKLKPDIIVAVGNRVIPILQQMTREVPIVFAAAVDPVGAGLVPSLARPGGNTTGFSTM